MFFTKKRAKVRKQSEEKRDEKIAVTDKITRAIRINRSGTVYYSWPYLMGYPEGVQSLKYRIPSHGRLTPGWPLDPSRVGHPQGVE